MSKKNKVLRKASKTLDKIKNGGDAATQTARRVKLDEMAKRYKRLIKKEGGTKK